MVLARTGPTRRPRAARSTPGPSLANARRVDGPRHGPDHAHACRHSPRGACSQWLAAQAASQTAASPRRCSLHLRLARAGGGAVGLGASRRGTVGLAVGLAVDGGVDGQGVGQGSLAHAAERLAGRRLAALLVRGKVEGDEEDQVRRQDAHAGKGGKLLAGAAAGVGHAGEVGRGEVGVRGKVDEAEINDELDDLEAGDPLLPPDADAAGALEVVPVHDDVDGEVEGDGDPGDGGRANELGVAEESGGAMVVAVEEGCHVLAALMLGLVGLRLCRHVRADATERPGDCSVGNLLRGFFLRNKKTVSRSSRYLVR